MNLALFDLDNTLLNIDSDYLWGEYLCGIGAVDSASYTRRNSQFFDEYNEGTLDIDAYIEFSLEPLSLNYRLDLERWRSRFIDEIIAPAVLKTGLDVIAEHRRKGDRLVIITSTNAFVTQPIAELFNVDALIATQPEIQEERFTGKISGVPCFGMGKITCLTQWLHGQPEYSTTTAYSDSANDIPLLEFADRAIAVDPDDALRRHALENHWEITTFR